MACALSVKYLKEAVSLSFNEHGFIKNVIKDLEVQKQKLRMSARTALTCSASFLSEPAFEKPMQVKHAESHTFRFITCWLCDAQVKVYGMKLLDRSLFTCGGDADDDAVAMKTLKMFIAFIQAAGELHDPDKKISTIEKAWLRAVAGTSLLKLCYIQKYSHMLSADMFVTLSNLMKDEMDCVRGYFVRRLNKGISRNRLTIEYLSFFSIAALLEPTSTEEENAIKQYREHCRTSHLAAISRRRNLIQSPSFLAAYLLYHQPEYAIAYAVWLPHQETLSSHSDIANMAVLQECLWYIMEPFTVRKENTDFEFIYSLLQDIKESNDALFDKRLKNNDIGEAELIGQSKEMWVLADLGILMLVYRAKVTTRNEPRKTLLSTRFFIKEKKSKHAAIVYTPQELIDDGKVRNGKIPTRDRKRLNSTSKFTSKRSTREAKNTTKMRKGRVLSVKLNKVDESPQSSEDMSPVRKKIDRKPLKAEQENIPVGNKKESQSPKQQEEKQDVTHPIPGVTGYISEGQTHVDCQLHNTQIPHFTGFTAVLMAMLMPQAANAQYLYKGTDDKKGWEWNLPPQLYYMIYLLIILVFVVIRDLLTVLVRKAHKAYKRRNGSGEAGSKRTIEDRDNLLERGLLLKDNLLERGLLLTPTSRDVSLTPVRTHVRRTRRCRSLPARKAILLEL